MQNLDIISSQVMLSSDSSIYIDFDISTCKLPGRNEDCYYGRHDALSIQMMKDKCGGYVWEKQYVLDFFLA